MGGYARPAEQDRGRVHEGTHGKPVSLLAGQLRGGIPSRRKVCCTDEGLDMSRNKRRGSVVCVLYTVCYVLHAQLLFLRARDVPRVFGCRGREI